LPDGNRVLDPPGVEMIPIGQPIRDRRPPTHCSVLATLPLQPEYPTPPILAISAAAGQDCRSRTTIYNAIMIDRDDALRILRRHQALLRARGIQRAAIFGSVSRGEGRSDSDLDVLIEIGRPDRLTVFDYVAIKRAVADLFPGRVDVVNAATLKPG